MEPIVFVMQFKGQSAPVGNPQTGLKVTGTGPGCRFTTCLAGNQVDATEQPLEGDIARFASDVVFTGSGAFTETGTITYGAQGPCLRFSTLGQGTIGPSADPSVQAGAVIWKIEGGEGQFAGATGFVCSNFLVGPNGEVTDNHLAVVFPGPTG